MGNCLVTKLNGVVNNSTLERVGERRWYVDTASTSAGSKMVGTDIKIVSDEGLLVNANGNTVSYFGSNEDVRYSGANHLRIQNAYNVAQIYYMKIDPRILDIMYNLTNAHVEVVEGSHIADFNKINKGITSFDMFNTNKKNFVDYNEDAFLFLRDCTSLTHLTFSAHTEGYEMPIADLGKGLPDDMSNLTIDIQHRSFIGSLEQFVVALRANNLTGSIHELSIAGNSPLTWKKGLMISGGSGEFSWTADTYTYKGETINA